MKNIETKLAKARQALADTRADIREMEAQAAAAEAKLKEALVFENLGEGSAAAVKTADSSAAAIRRTLEAARSTAEVQAGAVHVLEIRLAEQQEKEREADRRRQLNRHKEVARELVEYLESVAELTEECRLLERSARPPVMVYDPSLSPIGAIASELRTRLQKTNYLEQ